jgi:hypothetical protein
VRGSKKTTYLNTILNQPEYMKIALSIIPQEIIDIYKLVEKQPATPLQMDNKTAHNILRGMCKQQRSKVVDMGFYWVRDRAVQNQFDIGLGPYAENLGGYFAKHHAPAHHKGIRKMYIHDDKSPKYIPSAHAKPPQGCVDVAISPSAPAGQHAHTAMTGGRCGA